MAPAAKDVHWSQMKPPTTTHERLLYLNACQRAFCTVAALTPVSPTLRFPPSDTEYSDIEDGMGLDRPYTPLSCDCATAVVAARCVVCSAPTSTAIVCNPFSDWHAPVCASCGTM